MKKTGIVRKLDHLGRFVLPMELRKSFDLKPQDSLEIYIDDESIMLKPYRTSCVFCGSTHAEELLVLNEKHVCVSCAEEISRMKKLANTSGT